MAPNTTSRTSPSSALTVFVSQAYAAQAHQSDAEHDEAFRESRPGGVAADQRRDLREREDEDEVEEQLERRDALLAVLVARLDGQRPTS